MQINCLKKSLIKEENVFFYACLEKFCNIVLITIPQKQFYKRFYISEEKKLVSRMYNCNIITFSLISQLFCISSKRRVFFSSFFFVVSSLVLARQVKFLFIFFKAITIFIFFNEELRVSHIKKKKGRINFFFLKKLFVVFQNATNVTFYIYMKLR